jgi:hypothetical protein
VKAEDRCATKKLIVIAAEDMASQCAPEMILEEEEERGITLRH